MEESKYGKYLCSLCGKEFETPLNQNKRCDYPCEGEIKYECTLCNVTVMVVSKTKHLKSTKHIDNLSKEKVLFVENTDPEVLYRSDYPQFLTVQGTGFNQSSKIVFNGSEMLTYFCLNKGSLSCFVPVPLSIENNLYVVNKDKTISNEYKLICFQTEFLQSI